MSAKPVIRMPGDNTGVMLRGQPMAFLVTGEDTKHTSMFDWTIPAGFATGLHVHRVQEETFYVLEGECEWQVGDERDPRDARNLSVPSAGRSSQHHQRQRQARPRAHDGLATGTRTLLRRAGQAGRNRERPDAKAISELRARYDTDQLSALTTKG